MMFIVTQLIGLFVIQSYTNGISLPFGFQPPADIAQNTSVSVISILIAFVVAIGLFFLLTRIKAENFIKIWFMLVSALAIALTLNIFFLKLNINYYPEIIGLVIGAVLAYLKIFRRDILVHNITELLIYPGIAAIFIPLLNLLAIIILLFLISVYDIWAVWHSGIMQKMAKYQIDTLRIFTGFFIPYASKKDKDKIKLLKTKFSKNEKILEKNIKKAKIRVNLAILGGGDVVFPIIAAGVFYNTFFSVWASLIVVACASLALIGLFLFAKKKKFYPAMPFLTAGIYVGMLIAWLLINAKII